MGVAKVEAVGYKPQVLVIVDHVMVVMGVSSRQEWILGSVWYA
jgi:hypothetical protein